MSCNAFANFLISYLLILLIRVYNYKRTRTKIARRAKIARKLLKLHEGTKIAHRVLKLHEKH